jgi:hypothetical protein
VTVVPTDVSRVILETEVTAADAWARRHGWQLELLAGLELRVSLTHPSDGGALLLHGDFADYRALPPTWLFLDPETGAVTPHAWPVAGPVNGQASIFHSLGIICANFSRKAYAVESGPHDWGGLTQWTNVREGIHAETVGEMLAAFDMHLCSSPGRMG